MLRRFLGGGQVRFRDRRDAGRRLGELLAPYRAESPVVLGLARGGVPVAYEVAQALGAPLDVLVARKLGAPEQPELGIGAIAPGGVRVLLEQAWRVPGVTAAYVEDVAARETAEMERRQRLYRDDLPPPELSGRTAILVDDGLATGVTARAAVRSARLQAARQVVLAAPVCALQTARALASDVDRLVCVYTPADLRAISLWYDHFDQTTDDEVVALLRQQNRPGEP
jgi:predicted phosphoribosyltransferase